jgi:AcrR family transcriptional regulator
MSIRPVGERAVRPLPVPQRGGDCIDRPLRRDAEDNRRRVLEAAAELFATHGLDTSVEEIAHSAGVGMGTLYRRFPTKEALIEQLVDDLLAQILAAGRRALESTDGTGLETFLRDSASLYDTHRGCVSRMWTRPLPQEFFVEFDHTVAELVRSAQDAGRIRADCAPSDIIVLFWAIRGIIESTGAAAPEAWQRHVDIVLVGLNPHAAPIEHAAVSGEIRREIPPARHRHSS